MTATAHPVESPVPVDAGWAHVGDPAAFGVGAGRLDVTAAAGDDLFATPGGHRGTGVPRARRTVDGDFTVRCRVAVTGETFADAGGMCLHTSGGWVKLCAERTRPGGWAVVTVLTRPHSDEAAGPALHGPVADLLLTREGARFAALARTPGAGDWTFVRTFTWDVDARAELGLYAQAPFSSSCTASFSGVHLGPRALRDRR